MKRGPFTIGIMFALCMLGFAPAGPGVTGANDSNCLYAPTWSFFNSEKPQTHPPIVIQTESYLSKTIVANGSEDEHFVKGVQARQIKMNSEVIS